MSRYIFQMHIRIIRYIPLFQHHFPYLHKVPVHLQRTCKLPATRITATKTTTNIPTTEMLFLISVSIIILSSLFFKQQISTRLNSIVPMTMHTMIPPMSTAELPIYPISVFSIHGPGFPNCPHRENTLFICRNSLYHQQEYDCHCRRPDYF